jgi:hypothetical protein
MPGREFEIGRFFVVGNTFVSNSWRVNRWRKSGQNSWKAWLVIRPIKPSKVRKAALPAVASLSGRHAFEMLPEIEI